MILPLLLALSSVVVTPERPISPPVLQAAAGVQQRPAVATDGHGWLAAWTSNGEIVAARLDESGTLLDPAPIVIDGTGSFAAVASGPEGYLVVWSGDGPSVRERLVGRDGTLGPVTTLSTTARDTPVAAAFTGGDFLVTWGDSTPAQMAALLDAHGALLQFAPSPTLKVIDGAVSISAVVAGVGNFLVVGDLFDDKAAVGKAFAVRIGIYGFVGAPLVLSDPASSVTQGSVRAAWSGAEYFAAWSTNQGGVGESRGARVTAENRVLATPSFYAGTAHLGGLAWNGSEYLATLFDSTSVLTQRVAASGEPEGAPNVVAQPWNLGVASTAVAWNGQSMLIAYAAAGAGVDVWAKLTDASGAPRDPERQRPGIAVALSPPEQRGPSVSASIAGSAVVWSEVLPEEGRSVHLMTLLLGDTAPQGRGTILSEGGAPARIAFAGTAYALIDTQPFVQPSAQLGRLASVGLQRAALLMPSGVADDVVWDGEVFLVTAAELIPAIGGYKRQLAITGLPPGGGTVGVIHIGQASQATSESSLASNGDGALAVWVRNYVLEASVIARSGFPSGVIPIASDMGWATVRWNGRAYVVAGLTADRTAVRWFVVNANGTLLTSSAPVTVASPAVDGSIVRPRSASFGETTLVAWIDGNDIRGILIRSDDGSPLGEPFLIATANAPRFLDLDGEGDTIRLVYQAESPYPGVPHLTRVYTRTVALAPAPPRRRAVK